MVEQGGTTAVERLEIDRLIRRRAILPPPTEHADPLERQRAPGGVGCFARSAWRLGRDACPAGLPDRCRGPLHQGVAEAGRPLAAPVAPALLTPPCCDRCHAGALWPCGGGRAGAWCAAGDEEPGSADGASAWERRAHGTGGRALGRRRAGGVAGLERLQGGPQRADAGRPEPRRGGKKALLGRPGGGSREGLDALCQTIRRASMGLTQAGLQGRAAGQGGRLQGWPAAETVTTNARGLVLTPWERRRERVLQGPGEPLGAPPCALPCGVGRVLLRAAGGNRVAVPCEGQGMNGPEPEAVVCASGKDQRALVECTAESDRLAPAARGQGPPPRLHGFWRGVEPAGCSWLGACRV
jgi:hypothetical protein